MQHQTAVRRAFIDRSVWKQAVLMAEREIAQRHLCEGTLVKSGDGLTQKEMNRRLRLVAFAWED